MPRISLSVWAGTGANASRVCPRRYHLGVEPERSQARCMSFDEVLLHVVKEVC